MQLVFVIIAVSGGAYFMFAKRRFDFLSIGYISALVYFIPGFTGEVIYPMEHSYVVGVPVSIHPETYLVMCMVLAGIGIAGLAYDLGQIPGGPAWNVQNEPAIATYATLYTYLGMFMTWVVVGMEILTSPDKNLILEEFTRWSILWSTGSTLAFVLAMEQRRYWLASIACIPLMVEIYSGFRGATALAAIAAMTLWLNRQSDCRDVITHWKSIVAGCGAAVFLFVYKLLFSTVKAGDWALVLDLLGDPEVYYAALFSSEPFLTQSILNEVVREDFQVGLGHFASLVFSFILFAPELGLEITGFNDRVQSQLFPNMVESGIAANIWAEVYSAGGWWLLIPFIVLYAFSLAAGSYAIRFSSPVVRGFLATGFCYLAFLMHRNDLLFQITIEKRIVLFFALCWFSAKIGWRLSLPPLPLPLPLVRPIKPVTKAG